MYINFVFSTYLKKYINLTSSLQKYIFKYADNSLDKIGLRVACIFVTYSLDGRITALEFVPL